MSEIYEFSTLSSFGSITATGELKREPEDFKVIETLSFEPSGEGDHVYLYIQKTSCNTDWVAEQLVKLAGLKQVDSGYAGMKDRHAVTQQWFSLHMPNQAEPDWNELPEEVQVLKKTRHNKKLRTGAIEKNTFELVIRDVAGDMAEIDHRLSVIKDQGFPNYFGPQRFGNQGANVHKLAGMAKGRRRVSKTQRSMYISSGRSYLFNQILKERVKQDNWNKAIAGDVMALQGSRSLFVPEVIDETIFERILAHDIHPAAMLWGRGDIKTSSEARVIENAVIESYPNIISALDKAGVEIAYRAMRISVPDLSWKTQDDQLTLSFSLASGSYATSLLSEFISIS